MARRCFARRRASSERRTASGVSGFGGRAPECFGRPGGVEGLWDMMRLDVVLAVVGKDVAVEERTP